MARPRIPRPTDGEVQILRVLWAHEPISVFDIHKHLHPDGSLSINSILKRVQIMEAKGYLQRHGQSRPIVYIAGITEKQARSHFIKDLATRLFSGSSVELVLHALGEKKLSKSELLEIERKLQKSRGK